MSTSLKMDFILDIGTTQLLCACVFIFWLIYLYFVKDYGYWEQRNVPHIPAVFPFGSFAKLIQGRCFGGIAFDEIYTQFKNDPYVGFSEVRNPGLIIRDPELIKLILLKDFSHFTDRSWLNNSPKDYMMNNLPNLKGKEWKEMRSKLTPAYTAAKMKMMFFLVKKISDRLKEVIGKITEETNVIDVEDVLSRFTIDIIAECAFGIEVNSLSNKDSEFYRVAKNTVELNFIKLLKAYILNAFPIFVKIHCFDFMDRKQRDFFTEVIHSNIEYRERLNINRNDFFDLLIKLRRNESILEEGEIPYLIEDSTSLKREGLTVEQITAETFFFFVAGFESTSNTLMFCLYELACNCQIQNKLCSEIEEVLGRYEGDISYQALQEMTYMDQVINETMRCYPVFPYLLRNCTESYKIPNSSLIIEKGVRIVIPVYSLHHDPNYFPDPYTFDPERFNLNNSKGRHPFVFLPFGEGPRMCIGLRFGLMEIKAALATLVNDYIISLTPDTDVPLQIKQNSPLTVPLKSLMLVFTRRNVKTC